jgi:hypothetical protein
MSFVRNGLCVGGAIPGLVRLRDCNSGFREHQSGARNGVLRDSPCRNGKSRNYLRRNDLIHLVL